jgi:hypothetical protein
MPGPKATPPDYAAIIDQIAGQTNGVLAIETPNLGRVEFHNPKDMLASIYMLRMLQSEAAGVPSTGVIVVTYNDGLGCPNRSNS